ncbi:hypothetical protein EQV77_14835 [Halobacillus fulvus]|nr:hypothetical protein EQV77_14835 [Halobacillus fulvus]
MNHALLGSQFDSKGEYTMQTAYLIISVALALLSGLPYLAFTTDYNFFSLVTFGIGDPISLFLPLIYVGFSLMFALMLNKSTKRLILLLCSSVFLFVNLVYGLAVGVML